MFEPLQNDSFLRALRGQPTEHTPIWLMRQAGRYLPEYRATRAKAGSFMNLATHPDLACEVTLQPLKRFALDAAILFSDILTVPDAMGLGLSFVEGEGVRFASPVRDEAAVLALAVPDMAKLQYVFDAVTLIRKELQGKVPLIGFAGSPWTLACYMVEGAGSVDYRTVKTMLYQRPDLLHRILTINADAVALYLRAQIQAGAQAVMVFDSWGGILADGLFQEFSLAYTQRVLMQLPSEHEGVSIPRIVFTKGGGGWLEQIAALQVDCVGLDWTVNLTNARQRIGHKVTLQGNLDPMALFGSALQIEAEVTKVLDAFHPRATAKKMINKGHVFNLGHGINQFTPPENVAILVDAVHHQSRVLGGQA
jgi:uroporphyrinogen decarboxylase